MYMTGVMDVNRIILDEEKYSKSEMGETPFFSNSILSLSAVTVAANLKEAEKCITHTIL